MRVQRRTCKRSETLCGKATHVLGCFFQYLAVAVKFQGSGYTLACAALVHGGSFPVSAVFNWWSLAMGVNHPYSSIVNSVIRGGSLLIIFCYTADVSMD